MKNAGLLTLMMLLFSGFSTLLLAQEDSTEGAIDVDDEGRRARLEERQQLTQEEREARRAAARERFESLSEAEQAKIRERRQSRDQAHRAQHRRLRQAREQHSQEATDDSSQTEGNL